MHRRAPHFHPGLMTDMYHPDSAYVSFRTGRNGLTTFDLYCRTAPFGGAYLLVAGLEPALEFVQSFRYTPEELRFLAHIRDYDAAFLDELAELRFSGEILAFPEGTIAFPNEPILRVTAPFREAILLEAGLLQAINLSTLLATKASRIVYAAMQARRGVLRNSPSGGRKNLSQWRVLPTLAAAPAHPYSMPPMNTACRRQEQFLMP